MRRARADDHETLVRRLAEGAGFPHPTGDIRTVETHISWILLTGPYAYKLKKPVRLDFVDFSTLARRRFYCEEEIRLNRRLAPRLYLDVVTITGTPVRPVVGGDGEPIEYAVKMVQFPAGDELDRRLAQGDVDGRIVDSIAERIATFHSSIPAAPATGPHGTPAAIARRTLANLDELVELAPGAAARQRVEVLRRWTRAAHAQLDAAFRRRLEGGLVRECHGDMHLGNMALFEGEVVIFDGIEFNEEFRWIDVAEEIAFPVMDLESRGEPALAARLLSRYLEQTGDYDGAALLRYYRIHRALVRAKVSLIRSAQEDVEAAERDALRAEHASFVALAERTVRDSGAFLAITHGLSGSGKSSVSEQAVELLGAIRLRSDVERKRLHGLAPSTRTGAGVGGGIYDAESTERTYVRLAATAEQLLDYGYPVVVDASFLRRRHRRAFAEIARRRDLPFCIVDLDAPESTLRERIRGRADTAADPSEADLDVLDSQLETREPLDDRERAAAVQIDSSVPLDTAALRRRLHAALDSSRRGVTG